jgi:hypothetical protein
MISKTYIVMLTLTISMISKTYIYDAHSHHINDINTYIMMLNFDINDIKDLYCDAQF